MSRRRGKGKRKRKQTRRIRKDLDGTTKDLGSRLDLEMITPNVIAFFAFDVFVDVF